ncbi:MAG: protease HtpX [Gammaproteobacteria bacterium]|nr:protease HtpX [Gammaproteobacteria bacterium]
MKRVVLFLVTNIAIMVVLTLFLNILMQFFGIRMESMSGLLVFSAVFGMGGAFISLAISKWMAIRATGAKIIEHPRSELESWLFDTVRRQANIAHIQMPQIAIYPSSDMNAFATGMNRNKALVAVSTGLLDRMGRQETEAVLGHEISHVANGDMVTLTLIQGVLNTFVIFFARIIGRMVDQSLRRDNEGGIGIGYMLTTIFAEIVLGFLASLIVLAFSRQREFRADAGGAKLAGRNQMISALESLQRYAGKEARLPSELKAFGISGRRGLHRFLLSHPPIEERILRLQKMTGLP